MLFLVNSLENVGMKKKCYGCCYPYVYFCCDFCLRNQMCYLFVLEIICPVDVDAMFDPSLVFSHLLDIHLKHNNWFRINQIDKIIWSLSKNGIVINIIHKSWFMYTDMDVSKEK